MAQQAATAYRSAWLISGCAFFTGSSRSRMMLRPALSGSSLSGANRMVAPLHPPVPSCLLYVPAACHAMRMAMGHAFAFWLMSADRISLRSASTLTAVGL